MPFTAWQYYVEVVVQAAKVTADLTDYPVYLDLQDFPVAFFSNVKADGSDIRVTNSDGSIEYPREVVFVDTSNQLGEVHFLVDGTLSSSSDTTFRIYYGNPSATEPAFSSTYGRNNVWVNYALVAHMQQDPTGSAPQLVDSTGNGRDGTASTGWVSGDLVDAPTLGKELDFSTSYFSVSDFGMSSGSSATVESWINIDSVSGGKAIVDESNTTVYGGGLHMRTSAAKLLFWSQDAVKSISSTANLVATTNYHVAGAYNGTNNRLWINGALDSSTTPGSLQARNAAFPRIGHSATLGSGAFYFDGKMNELRISSVGRDTDWIATSYNNQSLPSDFYASGTEQSNPDYVPPVSFIPRITII